MAKTVKVRIAVAVDPLGCVGGAVIDSRNDPEDIAEAFGWAVDTLEAGEARYILEAELELPEPQTVAATVAATVTKAGE